MPRARPCLQQSNRCAAIISAVPNQHINGFIIIQTNHMLHAQQVKNLHELTTQQKKKKTRVISPLCVLTKLSYAQHRDDTMTAPLTALLSPTGDELKYHRSTEKYNRVMLRLRGLLLRRTGRRFRWQPEESWPAATAKGQRSLIGSRRSIGSRMLLLISESKWPKIS